MREQRNDSSYKSASSSSSSVLLIKSGHEEAYEKVESISIVTLITSSYG
jgi:hypothetical protein